MIDCMYRRLPPDGDYQVFESTMGTASNWAPPPLVEGDAVPTPHAWAGDPGYLEAIAWRTQSTEPGEPAVVWLSPLVPLVDTEELTDVQRLAMVVDSANGSGPPSTQANSCS